MEIIEELRLREPIFHRPEFETTMAPDYWEVGASGRRYSHDFIVKLLEQNSPVDAAAAGWKCSDYGLRRLGAATYLFTYTLRQGDRVTRRATIWEKTDGWRVLYHQGTLVTVDDDETAPNSGWAPK
jgi:hypothetical protein